MEAAHKKGLNAEIIKHDLDHCCKGEDVCGQCQGKACTIGFAKQCIQEYKKEPKREVPGGSSRIPTMDFKVFDEIELEIAIAHILKECNNCKEDHVEDCIINVIRNCYEVNLFGDLHPYEGSSLQYLMYLNAHFPEKAGKVAEFYKALA